jgi:hypothetical protein
MAKSFWISARSFAVNFARIAAAFTAIGSGFGALADFCFVDFIGNSSFFIDAKSASRSTLEKPKALQAAYIRLLLGSAAFTCGAMLSAPESLSTY